MAASFRWLYPKETAMNEIDPLSALQQWYQAQCNGDWEHGCGIKIDTLDNPGWRLTIHLTGTSAEKKGFEEVRIDTPEDDGRWLRCWVDRPSATFESACGPLMLNESIRVFLAWVST